MPRVEDHVSDRLDSAVSDLEAFCADGQRASIAFDGAGHDKPWWIRISGLGSHRYSVEKRAASLGVAIRLALSEARAAMEGVKP